jgi:MoaA/NifB/PqqE/SkfB family radical SAM enzyme
MSDINHKSAFRLSYQGIYNLIHKKPLAISLEITHSCNCNCRHCDKGGIIDNEELAPPQRFKELVRELRPLFAQISGGEPLLRSDVYDIIKAIKVWGGPPHIVFVTNAQLLDKEKYLELKKIGVDEFSISLDYPDQRHDKNRRVPGLYEHLDELIPELAHYNNNDITLISVIRKENIDDLPALAEHAVKWNVAINFSTYTPLRTGDHTKSISTEEELRRLRKQIDYLIDFKRKTKRVFTTETVLKRYYDFFANGSYMPDCRAGYRSLVINPDGRLVPCAMQKKPFNTQTELISNFSKANTCGGCYVSMRANTEKSIGLLLKDGLSVFRQKRDLNARR